MHFSIKFLWLALQERIFMININKDYVDNSTTGISSNISNWSYTYGGCYTGMTLLDKYYRVLEKNKAPQAQMPKNAQRDIIDILNNKHEYNIQVTVDYLTIEIEDGAPQAVCHVVIKEILYSYYSVPTISYDTTLPKPIEITCNTAQTGVTYTCDCEKDSKFVINSNTDFIKR